MFIFKTKVFENVILFTKLSLQVMQIPDMHAPETIKDT